MNARALEHNGMSRPGRAFSSALDSGAIEAMKWLGLVAMLVAHGAEYIYGVKAGWPIEVGRVAFPLFAVALAASLARDPRRAGWRLAFSLFPYALAAQALSQLVRDTAVLNILFLYISAGAWLAAGDEVPAYRMAIRLLAVFTAFLAEFSIPGLGVVLCMVRYMEREDARWVVGAFGWAVLSGCLEGGVTAGVGWMLAGACVIAAPRVPRVRKLFPVAYVAQFGAFLLWRVM